jgi:hypothetical protein
MPRKLEESLMYHVWLKLCVTNKMSDNVFEVCGFMSNHIKR